MPERYYAGALAVKHLALTGSGTILSAAGLIVQLNQPHLFMRLLLPYWFFLVSTFVLVLIGAFFSLRSDYMRSQGTPVGNFFLAVLVGLVLSFVILPAFVDEPSVGWMQLTGIVGGMFGTLALRVMIDLSGDDELREAAKRVMKAFILKWLSRFGGGV